MLVLIDLEIDLGGILNYVYRLRYDRNWPKKIIKFGPLGYELDLLLWKTCFDGHLGGHLELIKTVNVNYIYQVLASWLDRFGETIAL